jgi:hypothetical protein
MNLNFPNRDALMTRDSELHVTRRLPGGGDIKVRAGERITADHVIAKTDARSLAIRISIADQLGVGPADAAKHLLRPVGSSFAAGEAMAKTRKGLKNVVVACPVAGTLLSLDAETGIGLLAPGGGGEVRALVGGDVAYVDGKQTVSLRTVGSRLYGIVGIGQPVRGVLRVAVTGPGEELATGAVNADMKGQIVVGGSFASAQTLRKLMDVGALGVVTGGFVDREIATCLGVPADDRLAPWRIGPRDVGIADSMMANIGLMATEGFGRLPISPQAFAFLRELEGREVVLLTATRVTGHLSRPQLIAVNEEALDDEAPHAVATLEIGTAVRIVEPTQLGTSGSVSAMPRRVRRGDGQMVDVVGVTGPDGREREVALANVEIVA